MLNNIATARNIRGEFMAAFKIVAATKDYIVER